MVKIYKLAVTALLIAFSFAGGLKAQCTFTSTVPYYEGFNGITTASPLPACWARSSTLTCISFTNNGMVGFYYNPAASNYFWSHGILLNAGVIYSITIMYSTTNTTYLNWTSLSLLLGTTQTSTGLVPVASNPGPVVSTGFVPLTNTFVVGSTGIYYVAINGVSSGACCGYYMHVDDLSITIPCSLNPVPLAVSPASSTLCLGDAVTMSASGANSYSWSTGNTTPSFTVVPNGNSTYYVTGSSTLTGCSATAGVNLVVNPRPTPAIFTSSQSICAGASVNLTGYGAGSYTWSTGSNGTVIQVSPAATSVYTVYGANNYNCGATASIQINVSPAPALTLASTGDSLCAGEQVTLTATGGVNYNWLTPTGSTAGSVIAVAPTGNITYTAVSTGTNGCQGSSILNLVVNSCAGISESKPGMGISVYPNPAINRVVIQTTGAISTFELADLTGRIVLWSEADGSEQHVDIAPLPAGIYMLRVKTASGQLTSKIIKE